MGVNVKCLKVVLGLFVLLVGLASANAQSISGLASGSCSNNLSGFGYFYAYTYQYASIYNGNVNSESHSFSFAGFLNGMESARFQGVNGRHLIYSNDRYELAVPFISGAGLYMRSFQIPDGPDGQGGWIKLCSY